MLESLKTYWFYGNTYCAVEYTSVAGSSLLYGVTAKEKKGEYQSIAYFESATIKDLAKKLPKKQHCFLDINTTDVLIKEASLRNTDEDIIADVFPGQSTTDFYFDVYRTTEKAYVALCRRKIVSDILADFQDENIAIIGFRLGFNCIENIVPFITKRNIRTGRFSFQIVDNSLTDFKNAEGTIEDILIDDINIPSSHLIALGGLFEYQNSELRGAIFDENSVLKSKHQQKVFFRKTMIIGIVILFFVSLVNSFLFSSYYDSVQELQERSQLLKGQQKSFKDRNERVAQKQKMVDNILSGSTKSSFYTNRLVASQPQTILLSRLAYQPLLKSIRPNKPVEYDFNKIEIEGQSTDKAQFNIWMETLENFDWLEVLVVSKYQEENKSLAEFAVSLTIKSNDTEK